MCIRYRRGPGRSRFDLKLRPAAQSLKAARADFALAEGLKPFVDVAASRLARTHGVDVIAVDRHLDDRRRDPKWGRNKAQRLLRALEKPAALIVTHVVQIGKR